MIQSLNSTQLAIGNFCFSLGWKLQNLGLRFMLFREALRAKGQGWQRTPSWSLIARRPHRAEVILFAQRFLSPGQGIVLVDIGANVGDWAERFLRYIPANYIGFEPDPRAFKTLASRFPKAALHNCCVGNSNESVLFHLGDLTTYSSKYEYDERVERRHGVSEVLVTQTRIDEHDFESNLLVLKIDVQGAENEVLEGARNTLAKALMVILEVPLFRQTQSPNSLADIIGNLAENRFQPCYFCHAGMSLGKNTIPIEHDIIFVNTRLVEPVSRLR